MRLNFNKDNEIVGFEFMEFMEALNDHDVKMDKIYKKSSKGKKK